MNTHNIQNSENARNVASQEGRVNEENPPISVIRYDPNPQPENTEEQKTKKKPFNYIPIIIIIGVVILVAVVVIIVVVVTKKKDKKKEDENKPPSIILMELNEKNHIKTTMNDGFSIPSDKKIQVVGADYPHKNTTFIIGKNNHSFLIDDDGKIEGVTEDDFPLYYSFNATIINGSYLFKDVKCFKTIDLSKMDSSEMIDASNKFENSEFEEIYFGTENQTDQTNSRRYLEKEDDLLNERKKTKKEKNILTQEISKVFLICS